MVCIVQRIVGDQRSYVVSMVAVQSVSMTLEITQSKLSGSGVVGIDFVLRRSVEPTVGQHSAGNNFDQYQTVAGDVLVIGAQGIQCISAD